MSDISNTIYFEKIEMQNFKSIGYLCFDFLKHSGLNYVYGWDPILSTANGVGKSTFLVDAPLFALFDKTSSKMKKGRIANRVNGRKKCFVKFTFRLNNKTWRIENGISPDFYNLILINEDGTEVSKNKATIPITKAYVKDVILNSNDDVYKYSIIMSVANNSNIFNMKAEAKREFISKVFQFSELSLMNKYFHEQCLDIDKKLNIQRTENNVFSSNLKVYEEKEKTFEEQKQLDINELKSGIMELANEYKSINVIDLVIFQDKIKELEQKLSEYDSKIQANNSTVEQLEGSIQKRRNGIDDLNKKKQKLLKDKTDLDVLITKNNNTINTIKMVKNKIVNSKVELSNFLKSKGSFITGKESPSLNDFEDKIKEIDNEIVELQKSNTYDETVNVFEDIIDNWKKEIQEKEEENNKLTETITENNKKISKAEVGISGKESENISNTQFIDKYKDVLDIVCTDCYVKVDNLFNITSIKTKNQENDSYVEKLKKAISQLEKTNKDIESKIEKNRFFIDKTKQMINTQQNEIKNTLREKQKQNEIISKMEANKIKFVEVISSYKSQEQSNNFFIKEHIDIIENKTTPEEIDIIINKYLIENTELESKKVKCDSDIAEQDDNIKATENVILERQKQISDIKTQNRNIEYTDKKTINDNIKVVNNDILENEKIVSKKKALMEKINDKKKLFEEKKVSKSPYSELFETTKENIEKSNKSIALLIDNKMYYEMMELTTSEEGVRKDLITNIINMLNLKVKEYLEKMGAAYTVVFDQEFESQFITSSGECDIIDFSSGELKKLDIATIFAIRDILQAQGVLRSNIIVCDEIIDGNICDRTVESIVNMIKNETDSGKTVFLVSHRFKEDDKMVKTMFDNQIKIEKREVSSIVKDNQSEIITNDLK